MYRNQKIAIVIIVVLVLTLGVIVPSFMPTQEKEKELENPKFVISSWSFPDEYGQGIEGFEVFGNSTGAWVQVGGLYPYDETHTLDWEYNEAIKIRVWTWFNSTLTGASDTDDGKNFQRHNVTVYDELDNLVFSQQNLTWFYDDDTIDPPLWFYGYEVVLNFLPDYGKYYEVTVIYEIFW